MSISKERIRVLRIIARMNIGGPAIQITGLMQNLPETQFEQVLIHGNCGPDEVDYLIGHQIHLPSIRIEGFGRSVNFLSDIKAFFEIRRIIKSFNPHIIHTHTAKAGFVGRLATISLLKRRIKVHTFHGHLLHGYFGILKTKFVIWAERILAYRTDCLIAVGVQVRDQLLAKKIGNLEKFEIIRPGLKLEELPKRETSSNLFNIPKDKFTITWIGRVVSIKAPKRIIEIARACKEKSLPVQFVLVGDGPLLGELQAISKKTNLPVIYLGWQSNIEEILSFTDLVILTSENEGTPVALIQAQMAGIPVLATNVGSVSEVMIDGESGFCVEYSEKNFVDKILLLASNPNLQKVLGESGKQFAMNNFSPLRLIDSHSKLYFNLSMKLEKKRG